MPPPPPEIPEAKAWGEKLTVAGVYRHGLTLSHVSSIDGITITPDAGESDYVEDTSASLISITGFTGKVQVQTHTPAPAGDPAPTGNPGNENNRHELYLYTNKENDTDTEYLTFGWWSSFDKHDGTILDEDVLWLVDFYATGNPGGENNEAFSEMKDTSGTASYSGPATGMYARKVQNVWREYGQFIADASFSVNFSIAPADPEDPTTGSITGQINNFRNASGTVIDSSWSVPVSDTFIPEQFEPGNFETKFTGSAANGDRSLLSYAFHGALTDMTPPSIIGSFIYQFSNGNVGGVFAGVKQ